MSTTLRGVFVESLGGFLVVRGFAKLSDLARLSQAADYQREIKLVHQQEIVDFYERGEYLFFPEVVLVLELKVDYDKREVPSDDPWKLVLRGETFRSNVDGVTLKPTKTKTASDLARMNITVPDEAGAVMKRIDGNHRISAFLALADKEPLDRKPVSFCIVLMPQNKAAQNERALFYNINSKALPLTSEEVYKGIVDDEAGFPDDVLKKDFGSELVLCRHLGKRLNFSYLPNLRRVFGQLREAVELPDCRCSLLIESMRDWQGERRRLGKVCKSPARMCLAGAEATARI